MTRVSSDERFGAARRRALLQDILSELSGRTGDLLSFDDVSRQLHLTEPTGKPTIEEIPLDAIVGSVGRYTDFNRAFLPRQHLDSARWIRIDQLQGRGDLPPIDVFKVGDAFFVRDGNHRVSVARARGKTTIRARVVEMPVRVPLEIDTSVDDLILKAEYTGFLVKTSLDSLRPDVTIVLTRPGGYASLLQHIEVHQFYMGLRSRHYPSLAEAAVDWHDQVYAPVVARIRTSGILERFSRRTEADLYLWIAENHARLQMRYGDRNQAREAVDSFARQHGRSRLSRLFRRQR